MIHLYVAKFEVTPSDGPVVTFRVGDKQENTQEFKLKVPTYEMSAWAESVGCHVPLDPRVMANNETVLLDDPQKKGPLVRGE